MKLETRKRRLLAIITALVLVPALAYLSGSLVNRDPGWVVSTPADETATVTARAQTVEEAAAEPAPKPEPKIPQPLVRLVSIKSGDNLMTALVSAGAERFDAHAAIQSLQGVYNPRRDLRVGDELTVTLNPITDNGAGITGNVNGGLGYVLSSLRLPVAYDREVIVDRNEDGGFVSREVILPLHTEMVRSGGTIDISLFVNARDAGVPISVLVELIRIFSFDVDFQRDIWNNDSFEVMYERQRNDQGRLVNNGEILYAKLTLRGTELPLYRYETPEGNLDYFNAKGESVRKALMKTPIDGARLSSRFGKRKHPILGYTKVHAGVDFAAPSGTPVYAAGDGTILEARRKGTYGNYVQIRHNSSYSTAYAHLNAFARGVRKGKRVRQGQVIAYVGTTGRSTGPHLHYEVHRDGQKINPLGLKLPSGEKLKGKTLESFQAWRQELDTRFAALKDPALVAQNTHSDCLEGANVGDCSDGAKTVSD
ncbi:MAG: peptidoglycan DD-metalloendopeptidase family protein [Alphaproteobacteria bacterium]